MNLFTVLDPVWSPEWLWLRYATLLRATLFILGVGGIAMLLRAASPAVRAALWAAALIALLPLPFLRALPIYWSAAVLPELLAAPMMQIGATMVIQSSPQAAALPWTSVVGMVWLAGAMLVMLRLLREWRALCSLARGANAVTDPDWQSQLDAAAEALHLRRPVRLLQSARVAVPMTWGTWRPTVLLPADAATWPREHRRAVLLHELAHVHRIDGLLAVIGYSACALWWFYPGAWWAASRLRFERERACDERVLLAGVHPSDYAECLLHIADAAQGSHDGAPMSGRTLHSRTGTLGGTCSVALFQRGTLKTRLQAILAHTPARRRPVSRAAVHGTVAALALALVTLGTMRLSPDHRVYWSALESPEWAMRAYAAENIARFGDPASRAALQSVLARENVPRVHAMAAFGSGLRMRAVTPVLRVGRQSLTPAVR